MQSGTWWVKWARLIVVALTLLYVSHFAHGDGCYFGPVELEKKIPDIPAQRAVLSLRNGQERMIVESMLQGEGDRFGWIIPLPALPTRFEAVKPELMKAVARDVRPKVVGYDDDFTELLTRVLARIAAIIGVWAVLWYCFGGIRLRWLIYGIVIPVVISVLTIEDYYGYRKFFGSGGAWHPLSAVAGVDVEQRTQGRSWPARMFTWNCTRLPIARPSATGLK